MHYVIKKIHAERGNLWSFFSTSLIGIGTSFFLILAFANLIDQATLGVYQYIVAIASVIGTLSLSGMNSAIIRAMSQGHFSFLPLIYREALRFSSVPLLIATAVALYYFSQGNSTLAFGIFGATLAYISLVIILRYNAIYVGIEEFKKSNYLLKAKAFAPAIVSIPILCLFPEPALLATTYFASAALGVYLSLKFLSGFKKIDALISEHRPNITETDANQKNLTFAKHQSVFLIINTIAVHFDKIIIFQLLGAPATAMYYIATSIPDRLRDILKQFEPYLFSKFAKYSPEANRATLALKFFVSLGAIVPLYLAYLLFAPLIFSWILPQYIEAIHLTMIYGLTLFASTLIIPQAVLKAKADNQSFYFLSFLYCASKITLLLPATYFFGLTGAIYASTISFIIYTAVNFLAAKRVTV